MSNWCREKSCYCNNTTDFGYCKTTVCIRPGKAPTVEAIPVEWIEKQMAERENYGDFNTAGAIGYLLLSWEKENDKGSE